MERRDMSMARTPQALVDDAALGFAAAEAEAVTQKLHGIDGL